jgi:capsular polysaccharide biosynthesis protein/MinD-like ATPase involved in chromosome partitioning or flagellar assembly
VTAWGEESAPVFAEDQIDTRRYLETLRRNRRLIALIVVGVTLGAYGVSLLLPATYRPSARVLVNTSADSSAASDAESIARQLATARTLAMTPRVLTRAAERVPGESEKSLEEKVVVSAEPEANILNVTASDHDPDRAARIANEVAAAFIDDQRRVTRENFARAEINIQRQLDSLGPGDTELQRALSDRLSDVQARAATAGAQFELAERAEPPDQPASPQPVWTALAAFIASTVIGVLAALARDQLRSGFTDARELGHFAGIPVFARISDSLADAGDPRRRAVALEHDAFSTFRGRVERLLDPARKHVVLVTSAVDIHGKAEVSAGLARALAETGRPTLLVFADPQARNVGGRVGADALGSTAHGANAGVSNDAHLAVPSHLLAAIADRTVESPVNEKLSVLGGPEGLRDPAPGGFPNNTVRALAEAIPRLDYTYVVVDAPPLLVSNDALILAGATDDVAVVAELESTTRPLVLDTREVLSEIGRRVLGLVVIDPRVGRRENTFGLSPRRLRFRATRPRSHARVDGMRDRDTSPWWVDTAILAGIRGGTPTSREGSEAGRASDGA